MNIPLSIQEFQGRATYYPAGRVVPNYLLRSTRLKKGTRHPHRHRITFGADSWVLHVAGAHVIASDSRTGDYALHIDLLQNIRIQGRGRGNWFYGNAGGMSDADWFRAIQDKMRELLETEQ